MLPAALLLLLLSGPKFPAVPPVQLTGAWTSVGLPATPMRVAAHAGDLWVSGADEMIAESSDGGSHWTVRNLRPNGELLYDIVFLDDLHFAVFGSAGTLLQSSDAGATWRRTWYKPEFDLTQVTFPDPKHGYAIGPYDFATTTDGGLTWKALKLRDGNPSAVEPYVHFLAVAASGRKTAYILTAPDSSKMPYLLFTSDGGTNWHRTALDHTVDWTRLRADAAGFRLYGTETKARGATSRPGAGMQAGASSPVGWSPVAVSVAPDADCVAPGCLEADDTVWKDLRDASPHYWTVPDDADQPITLSWAAQGATFCRVSSELRCRVGLEPAHPPHEVVSPAAPDPTCVRCPAPHYPEEDRRQYRQGTVLLEGHLRPDGTMGQVVVNSAPSASLAREALRTVRRWTYPPSQRGLNTELTIIFSLSGPR